MRTGSSDGAEPTVNGGVDVRKSTRITGVRSPNAESPTRLCRVRVEPSLTPTPEAPCGHDSDARPRQVLPIGVVPVTDARYPDRWLNDRRIRRLSDRAHRVFVTTLVWSVSNRTDGRIETEDLDELPTVPDRMVRDELVKSGLWRRDGADLVIAGFDETQTTAAELDRLARARAAARQKKARQRAGVPGDVPGDDTGQARQGQARTGEDPDDMPSEQTSRLDALARARADRGWEA